MAVEQDDASTAIGKVATAAGVERIQGREKLEHKL